MVEKENVKDMVAHPPHYNRGKIEVIEFIEDQGLDYHVGNCIKYLCRAGYKDPSKELEDLSKAQWYLNRRIELVKAAKEKRTPTRPNDMKAAPSSVTNASNLPPRESLPGIVPIAPPSEPIDPLSKIFLDLHSEKDKGEVVHVGHPAWIKDLIDKDQLAPPSPRPPLPPSEW